MRAARLLVLAGLLALGAAPAPWDAAPWRADLAQMRAAIDEKYANHDWLTRERGVDLDQLFARADTALSKAADEASAQRAFDRLVARIADGHVSISWPVAAVAVSAKPPAAATPAALCQSLGYDARRAGRGFVHKLPGYRPVEGAMFPAGIVTSGGQRVGVVRIGVFEPAGYPTLCEAAVASLKIDPAAPCDEACDNAVVSFGYARITEEFEAALRRVRAAGATVVMLDIANNGGGSEWAEAAARMLTRQRLVSARRGFVRGPHWARQWAALAERFRGYAAEAGPADRTRLLGWAAQADAARALAETPCRTRGCDRIGRVGYATGLVGAARAGEYLDKPWGAYVFSAGQHDYHDGVWDGPLIVLINQETWSAAEEVAAMLQDNRAAVILGERSGGAGCGHTYGGTPTTLSNSGAVLDLPDCVRFRADGSNEVAGVIPDVLTGMRANDGDATAARLTSARLPEAVARAVVQYRARHQTRRRG
ncbi:MAG: hypothetical protein B7Y45_04080 [Sphingomonas sp. 28-66-16]|nr:MAG: hypothetical protein B7Y45_04080 [Sphingomonas sp. 28-66-16]